MSIAPANDAVEESIAAALDISRQGHYHRDLAGALSEFFRLTMVELCLDGRALFEIAYLRPEEGAPRNAFDLVHLKSRQMKRRWGKWYQVVPPDVAQERGVVEKIHIPEETVVAFTLPKKLGKPVTFAMEAMSAISDHRLYGLAVDAHKSHLPYDFSKHERSMNMALGEAMREIGWMGRGTLTKQITNYYYLRQDLRFRLFALELREVLLTQLNALLRKVGAELGWSAEIVITGLPERRFLEQTLDALHSGTKPFLEAIKKSRSLLTGKEEWEVSVAVAAALLRMNITARDCDALMQDVLHHKWEGIPHLWAHSRLNAQVELGYLAGRKGTANDVLDISRLGVALNDADIILCDTAMAENIKQAKVLDIFDGVHVFSMQQVDQAAAYVSSL